MNLQPKTEMVLSGSLLTAPFWVDVFAMVNQVASTIAVMTGAIVGIHAVYRIWKNRNK